MFRISGFVRFRCIMQVTSVSREHGFDQLKRKSIHVKFPIKKQNGVVLNIKLLSNEGITERRTTGRTPTA